MDKSMEDAFRFIDSELKANPNTSKAKLIEEASRKFDLNPLQTEFLINKLVMNG